MDSCSLDAILLPSMFAIKNKIVGTISRCLTVPEFETFLKIDWRLILTLQCHFLWRRAHARTGRSSAGLVEEV